MTVACAGVQRPAIWICLAAGLSVLSYIAAAAMDDYVRTANSNGDIQIGTYRAFQTSRDTATPGATDEQIVDRCCHADFQLKPAGGGQSDDNPRSALLCKSRLTCCAAVVRFVVVGWWLCALHRSCDRLSGDRLVVVFGV
jgi:hypothetical protein